MKRIYKYDIQPGGPSEVKMPIGSMILHVNQQTDNDVKIWAIIEDENDAYAETRYFYVAGTGHKLPDNIITKYYYLGTVHVMNGQIVLHVFEEMK